MKKLRLMIACLICNLHFGLAQVNTYVYPEIGKPMPDFNLTDVHYYTKRNVKLSDFKGKYLILDFGASWCGNCFKSYPKINALQNEFSDKLQVVLVLKPDSIIKDMYQLTHNKLNLNLPVVYDDLLWNKSVPRSVPHCIWIDKKGIVKAISNSTALSKANLESFLNDQPIDFIDVSAAKINKIQTAINVKNALDSVNKNDSVLLFNSQLLRGKDDSFMYIPESITSSLAQFNNVQIRNAIPYNLYMLAFFNRASIRFSEKKIYNEYYPRLVQEIKDSTLFTPSKYNIFSYNQYVPNNKRNTEFCMKIMQNDLENYFGLKATVETRKLPVWYLVANDKAKTDLKTKGGPPKIESNWVQLKVKNIPIQQIIGAFSHGVYPLPVFDRTGIDHNIDLEINTVFTDLKILQKELGKKGLSLIKGEKDMKCIVVQDAKPELK